MIHRQTQRVRVRDTEEESRCQRSSMFQRLCAYHPKFGTATRRFQSAYRYLVEGAGHHGDEHVEKDDDSAPVVDAEDDVADALRELASESLAEFYCLRVLEAEQRPKDRSERVLEAVASENTKERIIYFETISTIQRTKNVIVQAFCVYFDMCFQPVRLLHFK